jgi:hypothetical protein
MMPELPLTAQQAETEGLWMSADFFSLLEPASSILSPELFCTKTIGTWCSPT